MSKSLFVSASIDDFGPGPEEMKITVQSPGYGHWKGSKCQSLLYYFFKIDIVIYIYRVINIVIYV